MRDFYDVWLLSRQFRKLQHRVQREDRKSFRPEIVDQCFCFILLPEVLAAKSSNQDLRLAKVDYLRESLCTVYWHEMVLGNVKRMAVSLPLVPSFPGCCKRFVRLDSKSQGFSFAVESVIESKVFSSRADKKI